MALTNAQLKEILSKAGCPADNIEEAVKAIMDGHITSINALREERDGYKADADKLPAALKELGEIKEKGNPDYEEKFNKEHLAFENFKKEVAAEKVKAQKAELYRALLKDCKIEEKRIDSILKLAEAEFDKIAVKDGKLDGEDALKESIKKEWSGFIVEESQKGADVDTPPEKQERSAFEEMSLADKMQYANEHPTDQSVIDWLKK